MKANKFLLLFLCLIISSAALCEDSQTASVTNPRVSSELITPVNLQPLSIETVAAQRGIISATPARNVVVFSGSAFTGGTAALFSAIRSRRQKKMLVDGCQIVGPVWASMASAGHKNIVDYFSRIGKRMGLVSDKDFEISGFVQGKSAATVADVEKFFMAISFSDKRLQGQREEVVKSAYGDPSMAAYSLSALEKKFSGQTQRIVGCFNHKQELEAAAKHRQARMPELVSMALSRLSVHPEGFALFVEFDEVATARAARDYCRMFTAMETQQQILNQIDSFLSGRSDTLLLIIDAPKAGSWRVAEDFVLKGWSDDYCKATTVITEIQKTDDSPEKLIQQHFGTIELEAAAFKKLLASGDTHGATCMIRSAITTKWGLDYNADKKRGEPSSFIVMARGHNSAIFNGISSFDDFYQRLLAAAGFRAKLSE